MNIEMNKSKLFLKTRTAIRQQALMRYQQSFHQAAIAAERYDRLTLQIIQIRDSDEIF
jgi:hypothetical protein